MRCSDRRRLYLSDEASVGHVTAVLYRVSEPTQRCCTAVKARVGGSGPSSHNNMRKDCAKMTKYCPRRWPPSPTTSASGTLSTHPPDTLTSLIKQIFARSWFVLTFLRCPFPPPTAIIVITLVDDWPHDKGRSKATPLRVSNCNPVKTLIQP